MTTKTTTGMRLRRDQDAGVTNPLYDDPRPRMDAEAQATDNLRARLSRQHRTAPAASRFDSAERSHLATEARRVAEGGWREALKASDRDRMIVETIRIDNADTPEALGWSSDVYLASLYIGALGRERARRGDR